MSKKILSQQKLSVSRIACAYAASAIYPELEPRMLAAINGVIAEATPMLQGHAELLLWLKGGHSPDLAPDVVNSWWLRLIEADLIARFDPSRGSARSFFLGVMEKIVMETIRPTARMKSNADCFDRIIDTKPGPFDLVMGREMLDRLRARGNTLSPALKCAGKIILRRLDDEDNGEGMCAGRGGRPPGSPSDASFSRAKDELGDELQSTMT